MAQFGFGLNINETAQENGYDLYKTTLRESLGATAADNWKYNPFQSIKTYYNLENAKSMSQEQDISPINRKELNKEYSNLCLYFEQDEYQSVVDIMVTQKKKNLKDKVLWLEVQKVLGILYLVDFM